MRINNTVDRYGLVSIVLHWSIAVGLLVMIPLGIVMHELPLTGGAFGMSTAELYALHKSIGLTLAPFILIRLVWRSGQVSPELPSGMKRYEVFLAKLTHHGLYALMILMPITGYLMVSANAWGLPTEWFGLFRVPHALSPDGTVEEVFQQIHKALGIAMMILLVLHFAAVAKHVFVLRDGVLTRMLPGRG